MSLWKRPAPRRKLLWHRIKYHGSKLHPWEYACDTPNCECCYSPPEGNGWVAYEPTPRD